MKKKQTNRSVTFAFRMKVEATIPEFVALTSNRSLDFKRLGKGNHKIEVGYYKGGCCPKVVRAVIRNGMVTGLDVEPCKETKKPSPEMNAIFKEADRRLRSGGKWQPVPIKDFVKDAARFITTGGGCIMICVWGYCLLCCYRDGRIHCSDGGIATGPLSVG
jgi:hypothetical protein